MKTLRPWAAAALALLALSCASANKLSQRSARELAAGDVDRAYEHARAAVRKEPANPRAQAALLAVARRLVADREARVMAVGEVDTVAGARQALALADLRGEIASYGVVLKPDPEYARREAALRIGAAGIFYAQAEAALAAHRPKQAWLDFHTASGFASGYRDLARRLDETYLQALSRVAILPLADEAGVPGLPRTMADHIYAEVAPHIRPDGFRFTRLVDPGSVYGTITVAEMDAPAGGDAVRIGRRLGADRVLTGRVYGLRSRTDTYEYRGTIYRKIVERDTSGARRERFVEQDFHAVTREREVSVHYALSVLDVVDGTTLAAYQDAASTYARVVFTDFQAQGDCDDYCLLPPGVRASDGERAKRAEADWKEHFGTWTVPALLAKARKDRDHARYGAGDRSAFFGDCRERPVWLGELPRENELALIALDGLWQPALGMLQELDAK